VAKKLEEARQAKQIGSALEAAVAIRTDKELVQLLMQYPDHLPPLFIVSKVTVEERQPGDQTVALPYGVPAVIAVTITKAPGAKCVRCWRYDPAVGKAADHPELCARCAPVVRELASA
jgi:isoleucyl-tRNA synthetase